MWTQGGKAQYEFTAEGLLAITRAPGAGAFIIRANALYVEACVLHHRCNVLRVVQGDLTRRAR